MDVHETRLPGVGIRYDFDTNGGRHVGLIAHHNGRKDLVSYEADDPDSTRDVLSLTDEEADDLAELMGAARITGAMSELQHQIEGLAIDWLRIKNGSKYDGKPMGDTQARTRTGVSIVAVVRNEEAVPSPRPDFVLHGRDTVVVVGTPQGVEALSKILAE
jgi:TrkA domain protein